MVSVTASAHTVRHPGVGAAGSARVMVTWRWWARRVRAAR